MYDANRELINNYQLYEKLLYDRRYMNVSLEIEIDKNWNIIYSEVLANEINPKEKYLYCEV